MKTTFIKKHLSSSIFKAYLLYLEKFSNKVKLSRIYEEVGVTPEYLKNENNWVSLTFEHKFMEAVARQIPYEEIPIENLGPFAVQQDILGNFLHHTIRSSLKLPGLYRYLPLLTPFMNKVVKVELIQHKSDRTLYKLTPNLDQLDKREIYILLSRMPAYAKMIAGYYSALPILKNLPFFHTSVQPSKQESNTYIISVQHPLKMRTRNLIKGLSLTLASYILPFFLSFYFTKQFAEATQMAFLCSLVSFSLYRLCVTLHERRKHQLLFNTLGKMETHFDDLMLTNNELNHKASKNTALMEIINLINDSTTESEALQITCQFLSDALHFNRSAIFLFQPDQSELSYAKGYALGVPLESSLKQLRIKSHIQPRMWTSRDDSHNMEKQWTDISRKKALTKYIKTFDHLLNQALLETSPSPLVTTPIYTDNQFYGILIVDLYRQAKKVHSEDLKDLQAIGSHLATFLERSRGKKDLRIAINKVEELVETYSKLVPSELLKAIGCQSISDLKPGQGKDIEITVLFNDMKGFTRWCENISSHKAFTHINHYYQYILPLIKKHNGIIDKFIGDCVMAIFLDPLNGVRASIDIQRANQRYRMADTIAKNTSLPTTVGLCRGNATIGALGSDTRMEMTAISDTVNVASRLGGLCKELNAGILTAGLPQEMLGVVNSSTTIVNHREQYLRGRQQPIEILEIIPHTEKPLETTTITTTTTRHKDPKAPSLLMASSPDPRFSPNDAVRG